MNDTARAVGPDITADVVRALCLYAIAEFQAGHASTLRISASGNSFSVSDDGRGHSVNRTVSGAPYLQFIYTQLDYPFGKAEGAPVQLQGIGMSLINVLCSELQVTVTKADKTLRLRYEEGRLIQEDCIELASPVTGTAVSGRINAGVQRNPTDVGQIECWLEGVLAAQPTMKLYFNGKAMGVRASKSV